MHLVKQSRSSPHETFHVATNATMNQDEKTSGATIGYNVRVANNNLRYNLRLTRIASNPRNNYPDMHVF